MPIFSGISVIVCTYFSLQTLCLFHPGSRSRREIPGPVKNNQAGPETGILLVRSHLRLIQTVIYNLHMGQYHQGVHLEAKYAPQMIF